MASSSSIQSSEEENQNQNQIAKPEPPLHSVQQHLLEEQESQSTTTIHEFVHKTKTIQFLGRTTPIILQNDNGPCPLLAICNILLLRNNLNVGPDPTEVSQEKLLSLVAERLIDSNSNVNDKDAGYVENQQQNISDAIDMLPRLATGIDVNIKLRRIDDFEFTSECAIFDLLDIPLYHGWIVDPQDHDTANAIGSKSYNAIMEKLVALDQKMVEEECKKKSEDDGVDFAAATTATLGVPSPCLSKTKSFEDSPCSVSSDQIARKKGDLEEEAELLRALKLSEGEFPGSVDESHVINGNRNIFRPELPISDNCSPLCSEQKSFELNPGGELFSSLETGRDNQIEQPLTNFEKDIISGNLVENSTTDEVSFSPGQNCNTIPTGGEIIQNEPIFPAHVGDTTEATCLSGGPCADSDSSSVRTEPAVADSSSEVLEPVTPSVDGSEPLYEGEECILESGTKAYQDREPMYEGEVILAEQGNKSPLDACILGSVDDITSEQGKLITNFLKSNASQLTFYGLFCLQDGLKERELCVFFRNNHFSVMFKYESELYILATDQGYINQPDLVWEKLNEVNGDTVFMTSNFKEFKVEESQPNETSWSESNAMVNTADYIASIDSAAQAGPDLQLAIALQQQEYEQQQSPRRNVQQQPPVVGSSRLVTGPQAPRSSGRGSSSSSKPETKSKEKCIVM
ncbi:hypothetical protein ACFE04_014638 [Oxalis oulophora]